MIGKLAVFIFKLKAKAVMMTAAKNPLFKSALEDYAKGAKDFRKKLKDHYGVTDIDKLPRI
jgi:hypothetical protein